MKKIGAKSAVLLALLSITVAMTGCKRSEPDPSVVPAPQVPTAPTVPPAPVAAPEPPAVAADAPVPASAAAGIATPRVNASKGAATRAFPKPPVLRAVRTATQQGYDRIAFEFDSAGLPAWRAEYVDRPVVNCGSGEPVRVDGNAWLQISFTGAQAHTEKGESTKSPRRRKLSLPVARELVRTCDFEGEITYVVGVAKPNPYTPRIMSTPARLVIDIAQ